MSPSLSVTPETYRITRIQVDYTFDYWREFIAQDVDRLKTRDADGGHNRHANANSDWLTINKRPASAPDLNPVEGIWAEEVPGRPHGLGLEIRSPATRPFNLALALVVRQIANEATAVAAGLLYSNANVTLGQPPTRLDTASALGGRFPSTRQRAFRPS
ncbi:hypothetical protein ACFV7Q_25405 [Streptomyces sp. NPDC059851]|uniref:hypothetical protein n=1 Tax=Streptomyces sp. NPDC059851 TaxID=3346971 RepID=UPI00365836A2